VKWWVICPSRKVQASYTWARPSLELTVASKKIASSVSWNLSVDFAVPLNRHDPSAVCLGIPRAPAERPPFVVLVSFFPSF